MAKLATARRSLNGSARFRSKARSMTVSMTLELDGYGCSDGHSHVQLGGCAPGVDDE